jgi:hypothetical protein
MLIEAGGNVAVTERVLMRKALEIWRRVAHEDKG